MNWNVQKIAIYHKIGSCPIGEISVMIAISSTHRRESIAATEYAIDELKRTVPIWKKVIANYDYDYYDYYFLNGIYVIGNV